MWKSRNPVDGWLLTILLTLTGVGFIIFLSASVGLVARETGADFRSIIFGQLVFGLIPGLVLMFILARVPHRALRKISFYLLLFAFVLSLFVFIPGIGFEHGGAKRWIDLRFTTFQPAELLKFAVILYLAAWFSMVKQKIQTLRFGLLPLAVVLVLTGATLVAQPDIDTFLIITVSGTAMYFAGGAKPKHIAAFIGVGIVLSLVATMLFPHVRTRIMTFVDPSHDPQGASYQLRQSLIAVGSGGLTGKGFGKSVQKYNYLPESIGDSVYAVASEEFGFIGSIALLSLFFVLSHRGFRVATRAPDTFGKLLAIGIVTMFTTQALINIGSMIGTFPLSGTPLPFVSHGGSALLFTLAEAGVLLAISRSVKEPSVL